jgi:HSP20 family molecular chaperone IbpA
MFRKKSCPRCERKIKKGYNFCPGCGIDLNSSNERDYGFLGKEDIDELRLPFGFNMLLKPLMKEITKQMAEMEREMARTDENPFGDVSKKPVKTSFSIHIGTPGAKPVNISPKKVNKPAKLYLPKFSEEISKKISSLPRKEPETNVRRLADKIVYELDIPGVSSVSDININLLEDAIEIKAASDKALFVKNIDIDLSLINYLVAKDKMVLEFSLNK